MRTQVCITIDTEFSIGGAFADPDGHAPIGEDNVTCWAEGRENGLGFLLETFAEHGTLATFFTEALQSAWFGDAPMGRMIERLLEAGQDVQLHLHPCWLKFREPDWRETAPRETPNDSCAGRTDAELDALIGEGLAAFARSSVPAPVALRTGNLNVDRAVYRAMARAGLRVASNIGLALSHPGEAALRLTGGRARIEGVLEVPVLTYRQLDLGGRVKERLLTTTATSWRETEALLWAARGAGVPTLVLLTHPFEFIKGDRLDPARRRANRINQERLRRLCRFLAEHPADFEATSFRAAAPGWLAAPDVAPPVLKAPLPAVLLRMVENKANDLVAAL